MTQKRIFVFVTLLIWVNVPVSLTEQFLQGNVPLRHLLNAETLFMSWQRITIQEENDWALYVGSSLFTSYIQCAKSKNYRSTETKYGLIIFQFSVFFLSLFYVEKKMRDETKKSHHQKNSWNRWLCLLTYRPNLVFCSHHQSLYGTQVVFMWRMFLRLFCISLDERVWFKKNLTDGRNCLIL